ncbi:hypothetical protein U9M48_002759 [Paspalum notatum var. saurae]|uniref:Uncharacterized protein n=1 Tax=Paspalum notatum var. saurae TaxID=547442 RepID=A0AAQ3PRM0_PASNO
MVIRGSARVPMAMRHMSPYELFPLAHYKTEFKTLAASSPLPPLRSTPAAATRFSFPVTPLHPGAGSPRPARLRPQATAPPRLPVSRHPVAPSARPRPNPSLAPACFAAPHSSSGAGAPLHAPLRSTCGAALPQRTSASSPVWLKRRASSRVGMGLAAGRSAVSVPGASPPCLAVAPRPAPSHHLDIAAPYSTPRASPPRRLPRLGPAWCARGGSGRQPWSCAQIRRWRPLRSQIRWWGRAGPATAVDRRIWRWGHMLPAVALVAVGERQLPAMASHSATAVVAAAACGVLCRQMRGGPARPFPSWRVWHSGADAASSSWSSVVWLLPPGLRLEVGMFAAANSSIEYKAEEISINPAFQRWSRLVPLLKASQGTCIGVNSRCLLLELGYLLDFQLDFPIRWLKP